MENTKNVVSSMSVLKAYISCHSIHRPPSSTALFTPQEASTMMSYFIHGYYRHYSLFQHIYHPLSQTILQQETTCGVEYPRTPRPLGHGIHLGE